MPETEDMTEALDGMLDKLKDRLPGHSRPQRLALLRFAFSEIRLRCALRAIELDDYGKPKPPSSSEQAFNEVGDVLLDEMAAILDGGDAPSPPLMRSLGNFRASRWQGIVSSSIARP